MADERLLHPLTVRVVVIHDSGNVGKTWEAFVKILLSVDTKAQPRGIFIEVLPLCIDGLSKNQYGSFSDDTWKLFLCTHDLLKKVKDPKSPLRLSGLLNYDADKMMFLILADKDDYDFEWECRRSLQALPDAEHFHIMKPTGSEEIFNSIVSIIKPFSFVFHPNTLTTEDTKQHITLLGNKSYPRLPSSNHYYRLAFVDGEGNETLSVRPTHFNHTTLLFASPGHAAGIYAARLMVSREAEYCDNGKMIAPARDLTMVGLPVRVWFQSELDRVKCVLNKQLNPYDFLCEALGVLSVDNNPREAVDMCLTSCLKKNLPGVDLSRVFGTKQSQLFGGNDDYHCGGKLVPTLLHFACMYGLKDLTASLLRLPGSVRAYQMRNSDGDHPISLAQKHGFWDLADYMTDYMVVSAMVEKDLDNRSGSEDVTANVVGRMVNGEELSIKEMSSLYGKKGEGYVSMKSVVGIVQEVHSEEETKTSVIQNSPGASHHGGHQLHPSSLSPNLSRPPTSRAPSPYGSPVKHKSSPSTPTSENLYVPEPAQQGTATPPVLPPRAAIEGAARKSYRSIFNDVSTVNTEMSPSQRQLVNLQEQVKSKKISITQAESRFKEWQSKQDQQDASFQYKQERLKSIRDSLVRRKRERKKRGERIDKVEVSEPKLSGPTTYSMALRRIYATRINEDSGEDGDDGVVEEDELYTTLSMESRPPPVPAKDVSVDEVGVYNHGHSRFDDGFNNRDGFSHQNTMEYGLSSSSALRPQTPAPPLPPRKF